MIAHWCFVSLLCYGFITLTNGLFRTRGLPRWDPNLVLANYVRNDGYPFEIHHVTTKDGYILAVHRIPPRNLTRSKDGQSQQAVLIMHGLLGSSADWVLTGRNRSIAYLLSDNGYDVWLGNSRGTTSSKNHTRLSIESARFWDFSWHEMGMYDTPAMIDYILKETDQKKLFYIGFSQGTTQFWVMMSLKPEYNKKVKLMSALAPVAYTGHISGLMRPLSFFAYFFRGIYKFTGYFELLANTDLAKSIAFTFCRKGMITQLLCEIIIYLIGGFSQSEMDHENLAKYLQFSPAGCSYKQLVHYAMTLQNPGYFRPYDDGIFKNLWQYGRFKPPEEYPLGNITAPVILYNGLNDWLAPPKDVELLYKKLPHVVEKFTVQKEWNHFDFVYGKHVKPLVYDHLMQKMAAFSYEG